MIASRNSKPQIELTPDMIAEIRGALAEIDPAQMAIIRRLTPAQRILKGFAMSNAVRRVAIYRLRQLHPELSQAEASRIVLERCHARDEAYRARLRY